MDLTPIIAVDTFQKTYSSAFHTYLPIANNNDKNLPHWSRSSGTGGIFAGEGQFSQSEAWSRHNDIDWSSESREHYSTSAVKTFL